MDSDRIERLERVAEAARAHFKLCEKCGAMRERFGKCPGCGDMVRRQVPGPSAMCRLKRSLSALDWPPEPEDEPDLRLLANEAVTAYARGHGVAVATCPDCGRAHVFPHSYSNSGATTGVGIECEGCGTKFSHSCRGCIRRKESPPEPSCDLPLAKECGTCGGRRVIIFHTDTSGDKPTNATEPCPNCSEPEE